MASLVFDNFKLRNEGLSEDEWITYSHIMENPSEDFDEVLSCEDNWNSFYHLSEMRTSILNWYEFKSNASILEIGGAFGAITGMLSQRAKKVCVTEKSLLKAKALCKRYRNRENITVFAGDVADIVFKERFDYVILLGAACDGSGYESTRHQLCKYLKIARNLLKADGVLLASVDNYDGAKYQCGYPRPEIGELNENGIEVLCTKKQLTAYIREAGFTRTKFFYPFPDYRLPQEIYTDAKLPKGSIKDRVLLYYVVPGTMHKNEYDIYEEASKKGEIRSICNSYLVECSTMETSSNEEYVAVSTDRGKVHSFATIIEGEEVKKKALYKEGIESLKRSYDNITKIAQAGIPIVAHELSGNELRMPFVNAPKLSEWLFCAARESKEKFIKYIDKIYQCIVESSESVLVQGELCLKYGYIDMIPLNCFCKDGQLLFFDQEFCEENCPVDYILFRVIRYLYLTYPELESYIKQEELKEQYSLVDNWNRWLVKEDCFIWDNRKHQINHSFYKWLGNGKIAEPFINFEKQHCALYLMEGFDKPEKNETSLWSWVLSKKSRLYIWNQDEKDVRIRIKFTICPPPGRTEHRLLIDTAIDDMQSVCAPYVFEKEIIIKADSKSFISFWSFDEAVNVETGDSRSFVFQLLNPKIEIII